MADDATSRSLEQRVADLESRLSLLEAGAPAPPAPREPAPTPETPRPRPTPAPAPTQLWPSDAGENWLGRAGVALLVVGFVLLYRYAVQRGWLTPELRVALGLVVGAGLFAAGAAFFQERRRYRQILMAGGITVLFITGLAASELYHLISIPVALAFFVLVAGTAFTVAARQEEAIIASIASIGGLTAPVFLYAHATPTALFWLYLFVVISWTGVLVVMRGWERSIVIAAAVSLVAQTHQVQPTQTMQLAAILAVSVTWLGYAALPLVRARLLDAAARPLSVTVLLVLPPLVTLALAFIADELIIRDWHAFEWSASLDAVGFAAIALWLRTNRDAAPANEPVELRGESYRVDSYSAAACASVFALACAAAGGIHDPWLYIGVTVVASGAILLSERVDAELLRPLGHGINAIMVVAFLFLIDTMSGRPAFDHTAVTFATVTAILFIVAFALKRHDERLAYFVAVYFMLHVLLATELTDVKSAPWLASAAYGVVGSGLLIGGLARRHITLQRAGMLSLALLVGRLFLYDLANVDVGVRIVLFMVCGFAFLGLSYLVRSRRFA